MKFSRHRREWSDDLYLKRWYRNVKKQNCFVVPILVDTSCAYITLPLYRFLFRSVPLPSSFDFSSRAFSSSIIGLRRLTRWILFTKKVYSRCKFVNATFPVDKFMALRNFQRVIEGGESRWKIIETKFRARNIYIFQRV